MPDAGMTREIRDAGCGSDEREKRCRMRECGNTGMLDFSSCLDDERDLET